MGYKDVLTMLGGLALFLYGMNVMGDGLSKLAGGKLEKILERLTSKRIYAVLLGIFVTAVIQSSSATTVMVVGFVNSGIMTLNQAVGVIMGANIGTTVTSWLLSLIGLQGESVIMNLLKPASLASICAFFGILLIMNKKKEKNKDIGGILVGFAVLMFGMETMSSAVEPLADSPQFASILTIFSNPIMGIVAGAVLTAIIQSSSASVGILQALCTTGALPYSFAFPVIMGQNIGTCVTSILSSIGASVNARRASLIHLLFNVIGTVIFVSGFYLLNAFFKFPFYSETATASGIAMIHSIFNITVTIILYPFANQLVSLVQHLIRDHEGNKADTAAFGLDKRFLQNPSFALEIAHNQMNEVCDIISEGCDKALNSIISYDEANSEAVRKAEETMDSFEDEMGSYLIQISKNQLSAADHKRHTLLQYTIKDMERITDYSLNVLQSIEKLNSQQLTLPKQFVDDVKPLVRAVKMIVSSTMDVLNNADIGKAIEIEPLEQVIDDLCYAIKARHINRMNEGYCQLEAGLEIEDIMNFLERISDHCSNIAIAVIEISGESYDTHSYLNTLQTSDESTFAQIYQAMKKEFALPEADDNI